MTTDIRVTAKSSTADILAEIARLRGSDDTTVEQIQIDELVTVLESRGVQVPEESCTATILAALIEGNAVSPGRVESLTIAIELGADAATLTVLRDALRVSRNKMTIVLPANRLESLSRGRGWAKKGRGSDVVWGERVDDGYQVGPGRWDVGGTDGFSRKKSDTWTVKHVTVGDQTWTVAS